MNSLNGFLTAFALCLLVCWQLVPFLKKKKARQEILCYVTEHEAKRGTPTMGGLSFIPAILLSAVLFCDVTKKTTATVLATIAAFALVGFLDDFIKLKYKRNLGLRAYQKVIFQAAIAAVLAIAVWLNPLLGGEVRVPFFGVADVGFWVVPLSFVALIATTNGVNLTDGLDGLATSVTLVYCLGMGVLLLVDAETAENGGETLLAAQSSDLACVCFCCAGALTAFLPFNAFQAKVFMGDVGSLGLGALVAGVAVFSGRTLYIPLLGIVYLASCLSVILQVSYFKLTKGKRIFLMAPLHHHLQEKGMSEPRICAVYAAVTALAVAVCLGEVLI